MKEINKLYKYKKKFLIVGALLILGMFAFGGLYGDDSRDELDHGDVISEEIRGGQGGGFDDREGATYNLSGSLITLGIVLAGGATIAKLLPKKKQKIKPNLVLNKEFNDKEIIDIEEYEIH